MSNETTGESKSRAAEPKNRLDGKVVLITGASRGIGRALAHACAAEGARLAICARNKTDLKAVAAEVESLGAHCLAVKVDLADQDAATKLVDSVHRTYGKIDVLINNAGVLGPRETIMEYPDADWAEVIDINLNGTFWVTKQTLGKMVPQESGSIINLSSGVGRKGRANWGAYAVSKFAVEGLTEVLADEMKPHRIRVNSVNPGATRTQMRAAAKPGEDPNTLPAPADITNVFVYLASDASRGVTGEKFDAQSKDWMDREDF
ncbi:SDR family NAD(P)-dependent oxidoreductase [bacterium]|nr:SDR family NAD(P)-dependent oxidoreductase [bacterium]